jgi:hypothetical protein
MAKIEYNVVIDDLRGAVSKHGMITRQKIYRNERGQIIGYGKKEAYFIVNPRNFKRHPMVGKELAHHNLWREVCNQTKSELANSELAAQWKMRFEAQAPFVKGTVPDPDAPIEESTGKKKRYVQLHAFVRAMIYQNRKAAMSGESESSTAEMSVESEG